MNALLASLDHSAKPTTTLALDAAAEAAETASIYAANAVNFASVGDVRATSYSIRCAAAALAAASNAMLTLRPAQPGGGR